MSLLVDYSPGWTPESSETIESFLSRYRPSQVVNDGRTPWIWVAKSTAAAERDERSASKESAAIELGVDALREAEERADQIATDNSIPTRASKGKKSKKACREEAAAKLKDTLVELAHEFSFTHGKVLVFRNLDTVDETFACLARSLVSGPLKDTDLDLMKCSTADPTLDGIVGHGAFGSNKPAQHVLCLYFDDVFAKDKAAKIIRTLATAHGLGTGLSVKADLYTCIGLDSKNKLGMRSSSWTADELIGKKELAAMIEEHTQKTRAAAPGQSKERKARKNEFDDDDGSETESDPERYAPKSKKT